MVWQTGIAEMFCLFWDKSPPFSRKIPEKTTSCLLFRKKTISENFCRKIDLQTKLIPAILEISRLQYIFVFWSIAVLPFDANHPLISALSLTHSIGKPSSFFPPEQIRENAMPADNSFPVTTANDDTQQWQQMYPPTNPTPTNSIGETLPEKKKRKKRRRGGRRRRRKRRVVG